MLCDPANARLESGALPNDATFQSKFPILLGLLVTQLVGGHSF